MQNFLNSNYKFKYVYLLKPQGIKDNVALTSRFLRRKMEEYESLSAEIKTTKRLSPKLAHLAITENKKNEYQIAVKVELHK